MAVVNLEMEFGVRCSPSVLFKFLSSPSGMGEWFADKVTEEDGVYTFEWDGETEQAELVEMVENEYVVYKWKDRNEDYFEFSIESNNVTNETILVVFDNLEEADKEDAEQLWTAQISQLKHRLGS